MNHILFRTALSYLATRASLDSKYSLPAAVVTFASLYKYPNISATAYASAFVGAEIAYVYGQGLSWVGRKAMQQFGWGNANSSLYRHFTKLTTLSVLALNSASNSFEIVRPLVNLHKAPLNFINVEEWFSYLSTIIPEFTIPSAGTVLSFAPALVFANLFYHRYSNASQLVQLEQQIKLADVCDQYLRKTVGTVNEDYMNKFQNGKYSLNEERKNILYVSKHSGFYDNATEKQPLKASYSALATSLANPSTHPLVTMNQAVLDNLKKKYLPAPKVSSPSDYAKLLGLSMLSLGTLGLPAMGVCLFGGAWVLQKTNTPYNMDLLQVNNPDLDNLKSQIIASEFVRLKGSANKINMLTTASGVMGLAVLAMPCTPIIVGAAVVAGVTKFCLNEDSNEINELGKHAQDIITKRLARAKATDQVFDIRTKVAAL